MEVIFLQALHREPDDELTWHALADWFEENNQEPRAELVRQQRQLRQMPLLVSDERRQREERIIELLAAGVRPVVPEISNSIGMRFALIQSGTFLMGSPEDEEDREEEETLHEVTISKAFYLGVHPVTQGQWERVMGSNPSYFCASGGGKDKVKGMDTRDFPVENVSWEDTQMFLKKLAELSAELKEGRKYRLPSEAEWEYSARAGHVSQATQFGNSLSSSQANFNGNHPYSGAAKGSYLERTSKVGSYPTNAWGLLDMHGNVWEWCEDWYGAYLAEAVTDPSGLSQGSRRVCRGGGWGSIGRRCRSAHRYGYAPTYRSSFLGFRVAAVPSSAQ